MVSIGHIDSFDGAGTRSNLAYQVRTGNAAHIAGLIA